MTGGEVEPPGVRYGHVIQARRERDDQQRLEHPYIAAAKGYIDDVIDPVETRTKIAHALEMLRTKSTPVLPKKHGNMPL